MRLSVVAAALVAAVVGFGSTLAIIAAAAANLGADAAETGSWVAALCFGIGVSSIALSLMTRQPIIAAWSLAGAVVGAELRGTGAARFVGVAKGSRPDQGAWCLRVGQGGPLVLAESVVDALSLADLRGPRQPAVYASTAGNAGAQADHPIVSAAVMARVPVHVAADNDDQGKRFLARYTERWGKAVRDALPQGVKDWNDALGRKVAAGWRSAWTRVRGADGKAPSPAPDPITEAPKPGL